jgi:hypothetical protein
MERAKGPPQVHDACPAMLSSGAVLSKCLLFSMLKKTCARMRAFDPRKVCREAMRE